MTKSAIWCGLAAWAAICSSTDAFAAGFAIMEQDVGRMGTAFAGGAAAADDVTTIFFNPAGLTRLTGPEAAAGMHVVLPSARFGNGGSTHATGQPLTGGNGGDTGSAIIIPNFYYGQQVNSWLAAGVGINSTFGLKTRYDSRWVGRYHAVNSELFSMAVTPSLAMKITDRFSLGAGVSAQYLQAELSNAIDFGAIFGALGAPGMAPQGNDGFVTFKGDSWSWGYSVGALYEFTDDTRTGVAYRSRVDHSLKGNAYFSGVPSPNPTGRFRDGVVRSDVTLPDSVSVSVWHDFSDDFAVMADFSWTNWSTIDELRIRFDNPAESDAVTTLRWKDAFRFSLGAQYAPSDWTFRVGAAYDQSPVRDDALRTPRVPDSDRIWVTTGIGFEVSDNIAVNASYAHLFVQDADIRKAAAGEDRFRGALAGTYTSSVDIFGADIHWRF